MDKRMGFEAGAARTVLATIAYMGAVSLWFRVGLPLEGPMARAAGSMLFMAAVALFGMRFRGRGLGVALFVATSVLALAPLRAGIEGACLLAVGLSAALTFQADPERRSLVRALFGGSLLFSSYMAARLAFPSLWFGEQFVAAGYSGIASALLGGPVRWGASASGLHIVVLAVALLTASAATGLVARRRLMPVAAVLAVAPLLFLLVVAPRGAAFGGLSNGAFGTAQLFAAQLALVPLFALLVTWARAKEVVSARVVAEKATLSERASLGQTVVTAAAPVFLLALGAAGEVDAAQRADGDANQHVVVHASGMLANFDTANWDRFGYGAQGMYGQLVDVLEASGRDVDVRTGALGDGDLAGVDTLVLIVPTEGQVPTPPAVEAFVERGGNLLLLSDHTDLFGSAKVSNALLAPFGIEFRFDTAMESAGTFEGNLEILDNGVFPSGTLPGQLEILHGASLRLSGDAEPVVVGKLMFGDAGDRSKGGKDAFLGDYRVDPRHEQVGDLVLAAKAEHGAGRVLVFGDTSGFQNVALPRSSAATLRAFDWLEGEDVGAGRALQLVALLGGGLALVGLRRKRDVELRAIAAGLGLVWFAGGGHESALDNAHLADSLEEGTRLCLVSSNSMGFAEGAHFTDDSFDGLFANAMRGGLLPLLGDPTLPASLDACEVIVLLPTAALAAAEQERLEAYVDGGGTLLVATGFEEGAGTRDLLATFGFEILDLPMGAAPVMNWKASSSYDGVQFDEAWPVIDVRPELGAVKRHFELDGLDLVVERAIGAGRVIVIGDSRFLSDGNLEGESSFELPNIHFLADLLGWN